MYSSNCPKFYGSNPVTSGTIKNSIRDQNINKQELDNFKLLTKFGLKEIAKSSTFNPSLWMVDNF